jgi:hypothetical protein
VPVRLLPARGHGLHRATNGWKRSLKESLVWSLAFLAAVTLLKGLAIALVPGMGGQPLFSFRGLVKYDALTSLGIACCSRACCCTSSGA